MSAERPTYFDEFLEDCFIDAVKAVGQAMRSTVFWLQGTDQEVSVSDLTNWSASLLETCWCKLVSVYDNGLVPAIEAVGKANPGKRMELERLLREHHPKSPSGKYTSRQFLTENMSFDMSFRGVLTITSVGQRKCHSKAVGLTYTQRSVFVLEPGPAVLLLTAFDSAVPALWERAVSALTETMMEIRNMNVRYRLARASLEAFAQKECVKMHLLFDPVTETFSMSYELLPDGRKINFKDFTLDGFGSFFEWLPAIYRAKVNHWEYWDLPE